MSNLKPLNWQPNKDSFWSKNGIELVGAVGAGIAYTVTGIDGKYIVTISNLVKAERGQPRSSDKISKDFDSLDEAKSFVEQEHYPHFMSEFVQQSPESSGQAMSNLPTNEQIKELALANGFKLKEQPDGSMDLNPYVYRFARALFVEQQRLWDKERAAIEFHEDWLESD